MWAGCIWVPIYEVMTRKHLKLVTLEENLEMAADIGIDATTSLDEAFAEAMERHGPDAKVIVLPFARYQLPRNMVRMDAEPLRFPAVVSRPQVSELRASTDRDAAARARARGARHRAGARPPRARSRARRRSSSSCACSRTARRRG